MAYKQLVTIILLSLHLLMRNGNSDFEGVQNEHGQRFECLNPDSQPSLQHSFLKNHIVQVRPSTFPNGLDPDVKPKFAHQEATILRNYGSTTTLSRSFRVPNEYNETVYNNADTLHTVMVATLPATIYGSQAMVTVYEPDVGTGNPPRYSGAVMQIQNGVLPNISTIYAGWMVDPHLYGDNHAHFEIAWSDNGHGCTNLLCQGFVQVSSEVAPGAIVTPPSTINGTQNVIQVAVFQDANNGNWWLTYGDQGHAVGYWPKELFTYMADSANEVGLFGAAAAAHGDPCPPMGSGEWPSEGEGRAAYFDEVKIVDESRKLVVPNRNDCVVQVTDPGCYQVGRVRATDEGLHFYFGGAGCPAAG